MNDITNANLNNGNNDNNGKTLIIHTFAEEKTEITYGRWNKKLSVRTGTWFLVGYTERGEKIFQAESEDDDIVWQIEADALSVYLGVKNGIEKFSDFNKIIIKNTNYPLSRLKKSHTKAGYYLAKAKELAKEKKIEFILKRVSTYNNIAAHKTEKQRYLV